jgi:ferredoxin-type protein NapH
MTAVSPHPGTDAIARKGLLRANRWLILRRITQFGILAMFLAGPLLGMWIVKGNLASSLTLDTLPLTDPYVLLQALLAGHAPVMSGLAGALIVLVFYLVIGGRVYCSWVCPVNIVTDVAAWARRRLGIKENAAISRTTRYWLLGLTLLLPPITGVIVWELFNPVSILFRGLVFGMTWGWLMVAAIFVFDLFVSRRGWCGHLCPVGAFYSLLGHRSLVRVSASRRNHCDDCMDCFEVCPEPQVIRPALKGAEKGRGPIILDANCTNCGRCIDVCNKDVFEIGSRFTASDAARTRETRVRQV